MIINNKLIYTKYIKSEENKGSVIITHGIAEYSYQYEELASELVKAGYNVLLYDVRGHGMSQGRRGYIKSYKVFLSDLDSIVESIASDNENIYLLGHSMGAIISLAYTLKYNGTSKIKGLITSGITAETPKQLNMFKYLPYKLFGFKKLRTNFNDPNLSSKNNQDSVSAPFNLPYFTLGLIGNILVSQMNYINKNINKFNIPILLLHGEQDVITKMENSKDLFNKLNINNKELITYPNSKHNLFNDTDTNKLISDIIEWLDKEIVSIK